MSDPAMNAPAPAHLWPDLVPQFQPWIKEVRGRMVANQLLSEATWFRVGGPAQLFYQPADETDLAFFMKNLPPEIRVTVIGLGSNLLVRDGGIDGVVIRMSAKGFGSIEVLDGHRLRVGTALPDVKVATAAAESVCWRTRTGSVSNPLSITQALKGDIDGPVCRMKV